MSLVFVIFCDTLTPRHTLMLQSLKQAGWKITIIAWDRFCNSSMRCDFASFIDQWLWVQLPAPFGSLKLARKLPFFYYEVLKIFSKIETPDLIIFSHFTLLPLSFFLPGKKIYDDFEMFSLTLASFYFGPFKQLVKKVIELIEGLLVNKMDGVITVDSRERWLERFYKSWISNVEVIWNVPAVGGDYEKEVESNLDDFYRGRKIISFIGGLMKEKGIRKALEAAVKVKEKYPEVLFLFIGKIKDDLEVIKGMISSKRLEAHVHFIEWIPYERMMGHLRHSVIGLALYQPTLHYPYVSAGNGRKFFSYMQAGIPIVGPDFDEIGLIVKKEECGILIDTSDPTAISRAIIYLLDNPKEAKVMGVRGRKAVQEKYNWEIEKKKFLNMINSLYK